MYTTNDTSYLSKVMTEQKATRLQRMKDAADPKSKLKGKKLHQRYHRSQRGVLHHMEKTGSVQEGLERIVENAKIRSAVKKNKSKKRKVEECEFDMFYEPKKAKIELTDSDTDREPLKLITPDILSEISGMISLIILTLQNLFLTFLLHMLKRYLQ
jgi:hypothetical protein